MVSLDLARARGPGLSRDRVEDDPGLLRGDVLEHPPGAPVRVCDCADEQTVASDRRGVDHASLLDQLRRPRFRLEDHAPSGRLAAAVLSCVPESPRMALRL